MPRITGTTDRQSSFLRAFRLHQDGPPPHAWPSPAILRRWLRHDGFRRAFTDMQRTLKTTLSFQSLLTGLAAAQALHDALRPDAAPSPIASPPDANPNADPRTLNPSQRLHLEREKLCHRTALTFLRLAHTRLPKPAPRRSSRRASHAAAAAAAAADDQAKAEPPHDGVGLDWRLLPGETIEQAALRLKHPNCRPEVAIAYFKGEPHPDFQEKMNERSDPAQHDHAVPDPTE